MAMATREQNDNTGRTLAVIGGGAFLAWLFWRGRGKGKDNGGKGNHNSTPDAVEVWILSGDRIELDRVDSDLATVVARAHAAGKAHLHVAGDARQGWVENVTDALRAAGVDVWSPSGTVRNAALKYRPVGGSGEPYPDWIRMLDGKSGVYIFREIQSDGATETVYVGQSHTGRLYQTLTRHFQTWRRAKKFWAGQYTGSQSHDPGLTYDRERITVAVRVLPADRALAEEARLIARLRPRDNLIGQPVDGDQNETVPF
jgi:hypothetical protein